MQLRERLQLWTTLVVVLTTAAIGVATWAWGAGTGVFVAQTLAGLGALLVAHLGMRALTSPMLRQVESLLGQLQRMASSHATAPEQVRGSGPDLHAVEVAINEVLQQSRAREADLHKQLREMTGLLEGSVSGLGLTDPEGTFTYVNPALRSMFRVRGDPVGRKPLETLSAIEVHEAVQSALGGSRAELAFSTGDSDLVVSAEPLEEGRVLVRVDDVTEQREAERSRADFVANVSHELRTPVTAVMGYTETILADEDTLPPDVVALLRTVERNARRLRDLFEDLLKLHRIEVRRHQIPLADHRLGPLLEQATGGARDLAASRSQTFVVECPADLVGEVNPEAFVAIVGNLATNAVRYTPEGGHVTVRAHAGASAPVVEVIDDGIGIHESHHERIFERFYRVDEARSRAVGGTGLGLAIVKHYALACRCRVSLTSAPGEGTTFRVTLPG